MASNGDTDRKFKVGNKTVCGLGSFHKTLPHNKFGEVVEASFIELVAATRGDGSGFAGVDKGDGANTAPLVNPQGGLASDQLTHHPAAYSMPPAPRVLSISTATEMTELYWMALLRDVPFDQWNTDAAVGDAASELDGLFDSAVTQPGDDEGHIITGIDIPGSPGQPAKITRQNLFRLGLPGEELGPYVSQFFVRNIQYGTQLIDQMEDPYKRDLNFLTDFSAWLKAQNAGKDQDGLNYSQSNEKNAANFEPKRRFISTLRDLARFVHKDALHQAYFNASLLLLSGKAEWTPGNPYAGPLGMREAGFGVLGGPHILSLVSEVATRALKIVWNQKWQVHLRLRPEAYGGLIHVQNIGAGTAGKRPYGLPAWVSKTKAAGEITKKYKSLLLPMAFTSGSPVHPAYGAGHATVAGACVTVLKAYFKTFTEKNGKIEPVKFKTLFERDVPYGMGKPITSYVTGVVSKPGGDEGTLTALPKATADSLTIEGELNKLATNVAMGRSVGGVHWRSDNARSLILGEAMAAEILADITTDANERPTFTFRTFARKADGNPKIVVIKEGRIFVDGVLRDTHGSAL